MRRFDEHHDQRAGRPRRTMAIAAVIVLAGVVVAGCGDDDDGDGAATATTADDTATTAGDTATEADGDEMAEDQVGIDIVSVEEAFQPTTAVIVEGGDAIWTNIDDVAHTTTAEDGTWDSGTIEPGEEFTFTPEEPGDYPYFCSIHPSMEGELTVAA